MSSDAIAPIASAVAVAVSVWSVLVARAASRDQQDAQERLLLLESDRERDRVTSARSAALQARLTRSAHSGVLHVQNFGSAEARHVRIAVNGVPLDQDGHFPGAPQPLTVIGPQGEATFGMMTYDAMRRDWLVELQWEDDSGPDRSWRSVLTFEW